MGESVTEKGGAERDRKWSHLETGPLWRQLRWGHGGPWVNNRGKLDGGRGSRGRPRKKKRKTKTGCQGVLSDAFQRSLPLSSLSPII